MELNLHSQTWWCFKFQSPWWEFKSPRWDFLQAYPASRHPSIGISTKEGQLKAPLWTRRPEAASPMDGPTVGNHFPPWEIISFCFPALVDPIFWTLSVFSEKPIWAPWAPWGSWVSWSHGQPRGPIDPMGAVAHRAHGPYGAVAHIDIDINIICKNMYIYIYIYV